MVSPKCVKLNYRENERQVQWLVLLLDETVFCVKHDAGDTISVFQEQESTSSKREFRITRREGEKGLKKCLKEFFIT